MMLAYTVEQHGCAWHVIDSNGAWIDSFDTLADAMQHIAELEEHRRHNQH